MGGRGGVVVLTGDVHSSWAWEGPANDGGDATMVELVAPSVTSATFAERIPVPPALVEVGLQTLDRDLSHVELTSHGYLLVDCTPDRVQGEWWYVDPDDGRAAVRRGPLHRGGPAHAPRARSWSRPRTATRRGPSSASTPPSTRR